MDAMFLETRNAVVIAKKIIPAKSLSANSPELPNRKQHAWFAATSEIPKRNPFNSDFIVITYSLYSRISAG